MSPDRKEPVSRVCMQSKKSHWLCETPRQQSWNIWGEYFDINENIESDRVDKSIIRSRIQIYLHINQTFPSFGLGRTNGWCTGVVFFWQVVGSLTLDFTRLDGRMDAFVLLVLALRHLEAIAAGLDIIGRCSWVCNNKVKKQGKDAREVFGLFRRKEKCGQFENPGNFLFDVKMFHEHSVAFNEHNGEHWLHNQYGTMTEKSRVSRRFWEIHLKLGDHPPRGGWQ